MLTLRRLKRGVRDGQDGNIRKRHRFHLFNGHTIHAGDNNISPVMEQPFNRTTHALAGQVNMGCRELRPHMANNLKNAL